MQLSNLYKGLSPTTNIHYSKHPLEKPFGVLMAISTNDAQQGRPNAIPQSAGV